MTEETTAFANAMIFDGSSAEIGLRLASQGQVVHEVGRSYGRAGETRLAPWLPSAAGSRVG